MRDDLGPALGERAGDGGEHRKGRKAHHIVGDLEHHPDQRFDALNDRLALLADGGERDSEEQREDDDRQDLVGAHRLEDRGRDEMADEVLEVEGRGLDAARACRRRKGKVEADAWMKGGDEDEAERQGDEARENEPADRADADTAERCDIAHVRDARDQGREDERSDDHLDQAKEQRGDDAEIIGDGLQPVGRRRRAVIDRMIDRPSNDDPENEGDQDVPSEFLGHSCPFRRRPKRLVGAPSSFTAVRRFG